MTQIKISSNFPSIQYIEDGDQAFHKIISEGDVQRLFKKKVIPNFETIQFKSNHAFVKRELAHFFILKLQKWNKLQQEQPCCTNNRTQLAMNEFIYSSLKRIALLRDSQIDQQLQDLYSWNTISSRAQGKRGPSLPDPNSGNQAYQVQKSFKTNAPLLITQYWRRNFDHKYWKNILKTQRKQIEDLNHALANKQYTLNGPNFENKFRKNQNLEIKENKENSDNELSMRDNFMTDPSVTKRISTKSKQKDGINQNCLQKAYYCSKLQEKNAFLHRAKSQEILGKVSLREKIVQEELRRHREMQEIEVEKENLKSTKARLQFNISNKFYEGSFDTALRMSKTSQGGRHDKENKFEQIQKIRIKTGRGKNQNLGHLGNKTLLMPEISQITNIGLLKNPQQQKIKKKKRGKV